MESVGSLFFFVFFYVSFLSLPTVQRGWRFPLHTVAVNGCVRPDEPTRLSLAVMYCLFFVCVCVCVSFRNRNEAIPGKLVWYGGTPFGGLVESLRNPRSHLLW